MGQNTEKALSITHLTENFYVYTTYGDLGNGSTFPANGMYCLTREGALLFDTPWDTTQFQSLLDSIQIRHQQKVVLCIATHFHEDRTAGLEYYKNKGIKTYTSKMTDDYSTTHHEPRAEFLIHRDTVFKIGDQSFETFYPGKGHSPDNIVIGFEREKILYGGCFVKSVEANGPGNLSDADVDAWILSIAKVQQKFPHSKFIIPGHQKWTSKKALQHTLRIMKKYQQKKK